MRIIVFLLMLLGSVVQSQAQDTILNLQDPTIPDIPAPLRVPAASDNGTNADVKVPTVPCVATAAAPAYSEGAIVPCSTDLAGAMRTTSPGGAGTVDQGNPAAVGSAWPIRICDLVDCASVTAAGRLEVDGSGVTQPISAASLPLPTGAATEVTLATLLTSATFTGRFTAALLDADAIANETTTAIRGKCYLYNGASWDRCRGSIAGGMLVEISNASISVTQSGNWSVRMQDGSGNALASSTTNNPSASSQALITRSFEIGATTSSVTNVNDSATNVTLLSSNTDRLGATIYNDSTETLYVKLGVTASTTSFTAKVFPDGYFEVPKRYLGQIDGIWAADAAGAARITELTP